MTFPEKFLNALARAKRVAVLTGAGISAESGVPTFRDALTGLWSKFKPEELASPKAFLRNPELVWEWYSWRRKLVTEVHPNPGHLALAAMEDCFPAFTLITQNVDGLHQRAGSRNVLELHGNISRTKCLKGNHIAHEWKEVQPGPPTCAICGSWLRPDVVWFGESLPEEEFSQAADASGECEIFLSIGTSGLVFPAADLPYAAKRSGAMLVEINPDPTPLSDEADYLLPGKAGEILPGLLQAIRKLR